MSVDRRPSPDAARSWAIEYLRGREIQYPAPTRSLTVIDLYSGAGGLAYGIREGAQALGIELRYRLAMDLDREALDVYQSNIQVDAPMVRDVCRLLDYKVEGAGRDARFAYRPEIVDASVKELSLQADLVIAGPPCQGHSNLNNRTRRADQKNLLYLTAPAFAIASKANALVIENVPEVLNDRHNVVETARALLRKYGYSISEAVLSAHRFGIAQTRRRHFLVALRHARTGFTLTDVVAGLELAELSVGDAIGDLLKCEGRSFFDTAAKLSSDNQKRIDWLFDNDEDDLPNHVRPTCHQNGHTYQAIYGRLRWDKPSGTITTGFLTPGRGRYIHAKERRGLTPHEAARLQGFPDSFVFVSDETKTSKAALAKVIGDAVPPGLAQAVGTAVLTLMEQPAR